MTVQWKTHADCGKMSRGEDEYLFPYRDNADIKANTIHFYEPCVLKHQALKMIGDSTVSDKYREHILTLVNALKQFNDIDEKFVPENSLLREFLGE